MVCMLLESVSRWTQAQVIAEAVAAIGIVITLFYSLWSFTRTLRDSYYAELDRVYFELLKIAMERPYLIDFPAAPDPNKQREYDAYAFMVWNFIETIVDRCEGHGKKHLRATWYPIVASENALHREWFNNNRARFKQSFCQFMEKEYPKPS
ncbi:MAG TPA: hypothetical protein VKY85_24885 [Candidatus Angelobacter sp.]|nr:hypothetical protein [Candidatus Angelobacter sp.]